MQSDNRSEKLKMNTLSVDLHASDLEPALYIVATPIGNLDDITLRALKVLSSVDRIACEDTRVTGKLLKRFSINSRMIAYHDHNADQQSPLITSILQKGQSVALVSDAGTPLVSDPGYRLVNDVRQAGFKVIPIPGASSPVAALSASGLPTDSFFFEGFLPSKAQARATRLKELAKIPSTIVFLESAKRLAATLRACAEELGADREAVVARELTKIFETFHHGSVLELADHYEKVGAPKGEIVFLIGPPGEPIWSGEELDKRLNELLADYRIKEAADIAAKESGMSKRDLYQRALKLKEHRGEDGNK